MIEIRKDDDGALDEVCAQNCRVHLERMNETDWWMEITDNEGHVFTAMFMTKGRPVRASEESTINFSLTP